jgi:DNA-binding LacI/PurR family transcriptional regulator
MMKPMLTSRVHLPHIHALADKLVSDIRHRGLSVGDRYLTRAEVSELLGVQKAMAGKAMRHLAEQRILISKQRAGTFIGPGLKRKGRSKVQTVYVLLTAGDPAYTALAFQPFVVGIRQALPEVNVQFTFVPDNDPLPYIQDLVDGAQASGHFAGMVLVSCPFKAYSYVAELGVPAAVFGTLHSSTLPIGSVDADNFQCGRLLTQYLIDRGHRRIAVLTTGAGRPGDNFFVDAIVDSLTSAGLPPNSLMQRSVRDDIHALRIFADELLARQERPTAIITRGADRAGNIAAAAANLGLVVPDDIEIAFDTGSIPLAAAELGLVAPNDPDIIGDHITHTRPGIDLSSFPHVTPTLSLTEIFGLVGEILKEMIEGGAPHPKHVVVPVEFHKPQRTSKKYAVSLPGSTSTMKTEQFHDSEPHDPAPRSSYRNSLGTVSCGLPNGRHRP